MKENKTRKGLTWVSEVTPDRDGSRTVKRSSSSVLREHERWGHANKTDRNGRLLDEIGL